MPVFADGNSVNGVRSLETQTELLEYISGGHCGSIASAICMRYYYDYVSTNYVPSGSIGQNALITSKVFYYCIGNTTRKL